MGAPLLLTPEMQDRIVALVRSGNYIDTATRIAGISKETFYSWCRRGHKGEQPFKNFLVAVERAAAESEAINVGLIERAATKQWQAAAWYLERRYPKKFGRSDKLALSNDPENPLTDAKGDQMDLTKLSIEELKLMRALREKARVVEEPEPDGGLDES